MVVEEPKALTVGAIGAAKLMNEFEYNGQTIYGQITQDSRYVITATGQTIPLDQCKMKKLQIKDDKKKYFNPAVSSSAVGSTGGGLLGNFSLPTIGFGSGPAAPAVGVNPQLVQIPAAMKTKIVVKVGEEEYDAEMTDAGKEVFIPALGRPVMLKSHKNTQGCEWKIKARK